MKSYAEHLADFRWQRELRARIVERWPSGGALEPALVQSIQRFQAGEDGDGAGLIAKSAAAGDPDYAAAVRLFVAEEQNHARLLRNVLAWAGEGVIRGHWTDTVFVAVRRSMGLRLELMTLMLAEVVALRYYRALRDGTGHPLLSDTAARILADERRHVPFHVDRLHNGFADSPGPVRAVAKAFWWLLMTGATIVVALDHGKALHHLHVTRRGFARDVLGLFHPIAREVFSPVPQPADRTPAHPAGPHLPPLCGEELDRRT